MAEVEYGYDTSASGGAVAWENGAAPRVEDPLT